MNEKIAKLVRLLGSDNEPEAMAALRALKRALAAEGKNMNDLAALLVDNAPGPANDRSYADVYADFEASHRAAREHRNYWDYADDLRRHWDDLRS